MNTPRDLRYTEDHLWVRIAGDVAVIGLTDHGQQLMGEDMTLVGVLPEVGQVLTKGKPIIELESVKAVSRFVAPLSGPIVERNEKLFDDPQLLVVDHYGAGWMVKVRPSNAAEFDSLLTPEQYDSWLHNA